MKSNLVLIGFMGSGKSTIGRILAKSLEMEFVDTDHLIEKEQKMTIPEIFEKYGQEEFRRIECDIIKRVGKEVKNSLISTGGGIILNRKNIDNLKEDGLIVYLNVERKELYKRLKYSKNRPLLDLDNLWDNINKTMDIRENLYLDSCDYHLDIKNEGSYEVAEDIKKLYIEKG